MTSISVPTPAVGQPSVSLGSTRFGTVPVVLFFFIFYANLAVVVTRYHGVPQTIASAVAILLFIPIIRALVVERQPLVITPVLPLVLVFLSTLFLAGALSPEPEVVQHSVGLYLTEGLLLYLLVSNAVRSTHVLSRVIWTLILAGAFMGGLSIFQELTHSYANDYGGLAQVDQLARGGGFNISTDAAAKVLRPRLGGPLGSENRYAQILAVVFPLALMRAFRDPRRSRRLVGAAASVLIAGGIFLTFSRGAAVAVAITILIAVLLRELKLRHVVPALAVLTAVVVFLVPDYIIRLSSLQGVTELSSANTSTVGGPDSALVGRQTENLAALQAFIDHPVTGVGPGVYFHEYSRDYANRLGLRYLQSERRGHSLYLELAADTGIIGLSAFLAMVGVPLVLLFRQSRYWRDRDPERAIIASSLMLALVAYLASAMFLHLSYQRYFWAVLALASAAIWVLGRDREAEDVSETADRVAQPS